MIANSKTEVAVKRMADNGYLLSIGGKSHNVYGKENAHSLTLIIDGRTCLLEKESDPSKLRSPSPGKLVRYLVQDGCEVKAGEAYAEMEVMKMYMPLLATETGKISYIANAGSVIQSGDVIGILTLEDPAQVVKTNLYKGVFPLYGPPTVIGDKAHHRFRSIKATIDSILNGYEFSGDIVALLSDYLALLRTYELPYFEILDTISSLNGRIPADLHQSVIELLGPNEAGPNIKFDIQKIQKLLLDSVSNAREDERVLLASNLVPVHQILNSYLKVRLILNIFNTYLETESHFNDSPFEESVVRLKDANKNDFDKVITICRAHRSKVRNRFVVNVMDILAREWKKHDNNNSQHSKNRYQFPIVKDELILGENSPSNWSQIVHLLSNLKTDYSLEVSILAKKMALLHQMPSHQEKYNEILLLLQKALPQTLATDSVDSLPDLSFDKVVDLLTANHTILDILPSFFYHPNSGINFVALYTYVLYTSQAYTISAIHPYTQVVMFEENGSLVSMKKAIFQWDFVLRPSFDSNKRSSFGQQRSLGSFTNLSSMDYDTKATRKGMMVAFNSVNELNQTLHLILSQIEDDGFGARAMINVLNVSILNDPVLGDDASAYKVLRELVKTYSSKLRKLMFRRITFMLVKDSTFPRYFTFREGLSYEEDQVIRHIEPAMAYQLELYRLEHFDLEAVFPNNNRMHVYRAVGKRNKSDVRFFLRTLVFPDQISQNWSAKDTTQYLAFEGNRVMDEALASLEILSSSFTNSDCNHFFMSFVPRFNVDLISAEHSVNKLIERYGTRLWKLRITGGEVRFIIKTSANQPPRPIRFVISSSTGFTTKVEAYQEAMDATGVNRLVSINTPPGSMHNLPVANPYTTKETIQPKRYKSHLLGTTYVYDFPDLFKRALEKKWTDYQKDNLTRPPSSCLKITEYALDSKKMFVSVFREKGTNTCGIVVWVMELFTPEYPQGREIVVIANDITYQIGSFGPEEDELFFKASEYSRMKGIPRIYISANSGARIGLADEILNCFKIGWVNEDDPTKGFSYLYLDQDSYDKYASDFDSASVRVEKIVHLNETRYKIDYIIGSKDGLGVENLSGSGLIAGETARAYDEIFTLTMVTCRSVGIGAYLVRLGQRTIQVEYSPILLTGANALNKVLGMEMYTSNLQLGGTQIMHNNGVSHLVAENDYQGVFKIIEWLSFVPKSNTSSLSVLPPSDSIDREIGTELSNTSTDPRRLIAGYYNESDEWISGFFDKGSFIETLAGWAKGVIVGRARLGAVETRSTETVIYADPANTASVEQTITEAAQVWYPNSAFKTAQAIKDFNRGEQLPLMIFANWRGFSGGQSDMYKEVLKFGSYIVDALVEFKRPVFVYIVGQLRGGSWVVLDSKINPAFMEMYAEENSRGGVIEPEGIVEIKFRKAQIQATMERLDFTYNSLKQKLNDPTISQVEKAVLKIEFDAREKKLMPLYHQAAVEFADLHDKPGRMIAKDVIKLVVSWGESRRFFYWRLLRRVNEETLLKSVMMADDSISRSNAEILVAGWFIVDIHSIEASEANPTRDTNPHCPLADIHSPLNPNHLNIYQTQDSEVISWINGFKKSIDKRISKLHFEYVKKQAQLMVKLNGKAALEGFIASLELMNAEVKASVSSEISKML